MKIRWIILIVAASLVVGAIGYVVARVAAVSAAFTPPEPDLAAEASLRDQSFALKLLQRLGYNVRAHSFPFERGSYDVIVRRYRGGGEMDVWRDWLKKGKRLVLLCRFTGGDGRTRSVSSTHPLLRSVSKLSLDARATLENFPRLPDPASREIVLGTGNAPLIVREKERAGGEIVYVADENAFSDRNLVRGDNFYLLNNCLVDHFNSPIAFDDAPLPQSSASRRGSSSWFDAAGDGGDVFFLFRGNFLFLFLELLLLGLVFILAFWKRFGPVRDREQFARRSLLRHLDATGNFFEKTANPLVAVDILDRYFLARLRELLRLVSGSRSDIESEVKRRLPPEDAVDAPGGDVFSLNRKQNLTARDFQRERIISRLKGVDRHHGKNKNPG